MDDYQDEFFDKKIKSNSSPKSAHNPLYKDVFIEEYNDSDEEKKEDFG